jgi:excisionase family DNA binding protein
VGKSNPVEQIHFYSFEEACEILKTSPHTLRQAIKDGQISACKLGGRWKFTDKSFSEFATRKDKPAIYATNIIPISQNKGRSSQRKKSSFTSYRQHAKEIGII